MWQVEVRHAKAVCRLALDGSDCGSPFIRDVVDVYSRAITKDYNKYSDSSWNFHLQGGPK